MFNKGKLYNNVIEKVFYLHSKIEITIHHTYQERSSCHREYDDSLSLCNCILIDTKIHIKDMDKGNNSRFQNNHCHKLGKKWT